MIKFQKRPMRSYVLALTIFLLGWIIPFTRAQEQGAQTKPGEARAAEAPAAQEKSKEPQAKASTSGGAAAGQGADQATISAGMAAFERSCTKCHDAARSLERTKDLAGWRATVRRMAAKRDADIPASDIEPIAV